MLAALALVLISESPTVTITAPLSGWTTERITTVTGSANNASALATLSVNGVERPLPIEGGQFTATFALGRGANAIEVIAFASDGTSAPGRARINLYAQIPRLDLQVLLFWDTNQTDVDLHITEPSGETVNYTSKESKNGGRLDRDDTDGYGPEIYVISSAPTGEYKIAAHYYGDRDTGQSTATIQVIAREGTDEEMRWRFEVPLVREGEMVELATIDLPPPGIKLDAKKKK